MKFYLLSILYQIIKNISIKMHQNYDYQFSLLRQNDKNVQKESKKESKKDYIKINMDKEENKTLLENINEKYVTINNTIDDYNLNELNKHIVQIDNDITNMLSLEMDINYIIIENHKSRLTKLYNIILKLQEDYKNNNKILNLEEENNFYTELINNIDKLYKKINILDNNKKLCEILEKIKEFELTNNTELVNNSNNNVKTIKTYISIVSWLMIFTIVILAILLLFVIINIVIMYNCI
ncbi:hypothetical protein Hokovirus_1_82 [Hokovirus HKV1]|uniref:Uncharacterized protein n=1 Tax=Hokovirus HKV1 TaxID=1977638 RepID=A0A1V0SER1_9VIRU|nr:hypothetical protein Hokovirus_1_82 [Hokovirus HKV1]